MQFEVKNLISRWVICRFDIWQSIIIKMSFKDSKKPHILSDRASWNIFFNEKQNGLFNQSLQMVNKKLKSLKEINFRLLSYSLVLSLHYSLSRD